MKCEDCGHEYNYDDPASTRSYFTIERRSEAFHGRKSVIAYCVGCAPFGNTKIPDKLK